MERRSRRRASSQHVKLKGKKEERRKEREGQKVRDDGFLEAQREPRVSCVAGCGTKVAENDQTNKPS